ncbi:hypothetical protein [Dongia mobilis]|uniref:hypothetical protein n=1 Tax=Dongia sp. TaxID=1977262 RepID=UPI0026F2ADFF
MPMLHRNKRLTFVLARRASLGGRLYSPILIVFLAVLGAAPASPSGASFAFAVRLENRIFVKSSSDFRKNFG